MYDAKNKVFYGASESRKDGQAGVLSGKAQGSVWGAHQEVGGQSQPGALTTGRDAVTNPVANAPSST